MPAHQICGFYTLKSKYVWQLPCVAVVVPDGAKPAEALPKVCGEPRSQTGIAELPEQSTP